MSHLGVTFYSCLNILIKILRSSPGQMRSICTGEPGALQLFSYDTLFALRGVSMPPLEKGCRRRLPPKPSSLAVGRVKQLLAAPLPGKCPGERGCQGLPYGVSLRLPLDSNLPNKKPPFLAALCLITLNNLLTVLLLKSVSLYKLLLIGSMHMNRS